MKYGQKLKIGDAHVTPRNIEELQASNLGDAPRHPFFMNKISGHLSITLSWSVFIFAFSFFFCCNK
jgi:hypothetical protein